MLAGLFLPFKGYSFDHITMKLKNFSSTQDNFEFDLYLVNDGLTKLSLSAFTFGLNLNEKIINGGSLNCEFEIDKRFQSSNNLPSHAISTNKTSQVYQIRLATCSLESSKAIELLQGVPFFAGHCKIINSALWKQATSPLLSLQNCYNLGLTSSQIMVYDQNNLQPIVLTHLMDNIASELESIPLFNLQDSEINHDLTKRIQGENLTGKMKVYPNPCPGNLFVEYNLPNGKKVAEVRLLDLTGKLIMSKSTAAEVANRVMITIPENISSGLVYCQLIADGQILDNKKIIIERD